MFTSSGRPLRCDASVTHTTRPREQRKRRVWVVLWKNLNQRTEGPGMHKMRKSGSVRRDHAGSARDSIDLLVKSESLKIDFLESERLKRRDHCLLIHQLPATSPPQVYALA